MKNFVQPGDKIEFLNDTGGDLLSGDVVQIDTDGLVGVMEVDLADESPNITGTALVRGVVELAKDTSTAMAQGELVEWQNAGSKVVANTAGDFDIGHVWEAESSSAALVKVRLLNP